MFETIISEFVRKSGHFERSKPPSLFHKFICIDFGSRLIYVVQKKKKQQRFVNHEKRRRNPHETSHRFCQGLLGTILGAKICPTMFFKPQGKRESSAASLVTSGKLWKIKEKGFCLLSFLCQEFDRFLFHNGVTPTSKIHSSGQIFREIRKELQISCVLARSHKIHEQVVSLKEEL